MLNFSFIFAFFMREFNQSHFKFLLYKMIFNLYDMLWYILIG